MVSGCMFYNTHGGSAMEIGYETITDHIRNIRFEDIDVLAVHQFGSVLASTMETAPGSRTSSGTISVSSITLTR